MVRILIAHLACQKPYVIANGMIRALRTSEPLKPSQDADEGN